MSVQANLQLLDGPAKKVLGLIWRLSKNTFRSRFLFVSAFSVAPRTALNLLPRVAVLSPKVRSSRFCWIWNSGTLQTWMEITSAYRAFSRLSSYAAPNSVVLYWPLVTTRCIVLHHEPVSFSSIWMSGIRRRQLHQNPRLKTYILLFNQSLKLTIAFTHVDDFVLAHGSSSE